MTTTTAYVWIVLGDSDYGLPSMLAVFATQEAAKRAIETWRSTPKYQKFYKGYHIQMWELRVD
jgi:hypothetical protein